MTTRTDIAVTTELGAELNDRGDLVTTEHPSSEDPIVQRAMLRIMNIAVPWYGEPITRDRALSYRAAVEDALEDDPVVDTPIDVRISDIETNTLILTVQLGETAFQFDGPLNEMGEAP